MNKIEEIKEKQIIEISEQFLNIIKENKMKSRAKFRCVTADNVGLKDANSHFVLIPVYSSSEDNDMFFKSTPSGTIMLDVTNEAVVFEVGKEYYVDFTEAVQ